MNVDPNMENLRYHRCDKRVRWELRDARGIFCCYVCPKCETAKRRQFRAEIFNDPDYSHDEPIDDD